MERGEAQSPSVHAVERWTPRERPQLEEPGQLRATSRYLDRFASYEAEVTTRFKGITANGTIEPGLFRLETTGVSTAPIRRAAEAFLGELDPLHRSRALFPVDSPEWRKWHGFFTTLFRHGVLIEDLTELQREKACALIEASLSEDGFATVQGIRSTNELVRELTGRYIDFGENMYWLSIMGVPSETEPWGWQLDGHHVNINFFVLGDQVVMTPIFLGAEPTSVWTGKYAGVELFVDEERDAVRVVRALSPAQRNRAIIDDELRIDLFTGFFRDNHELRYEGVAARDFSEKQLALLTRLIEDYIGNMPEGHANRRSTEVTRHLENTYFGWIGGFEDEEPFYYRIHSPVILIEFSHIPGIALTGSAPSRNHIHTVVRTPNGNDYGADLLRQHLERKHDGIA